MSDKAMHWVMVLCSWAAVAMVTMAVNYVPWAWLRLLLWAVILIFVAAYFGSTYDKRKEDKRD